MKRAVLFLFAMAALPLVLTAQNSAVDELFYKYKGKEGVTTVQISPELFQIVQAMEVEKVEQHNIPLDKIASVKILTIEDESLWEGVNFYDEIINDLDVSNFAELMTVDDGGETVRMWLKADGSQVSEFLLIVGGDDNVVIHITGSFRMEDLQGMAKSLGHDVDIEL
ncbi:MAG: DUF4252 domain-containing protein [Bacteroidales bacterium]